MADIRRDPSVARSVFAALHEAGTFLMPNAWDIGSGRILEAMGVAAIATTSSGFAATLGRMDQRITLDEVVEHAAALVRAVDIPVSVDAEHCYADSIDGVAATVDRIAGTGAAGVSIEDYDPAIGVLPVDVATSRVEAAAHAAHRHGMVLTGRAESLLYGDGDKADTIARLTRYRDAGADVVYAPGLSDIDAITELVAAVETPVNVLLLTDGPTVAELGAAGVRRLSTGGSLAFAAYGALVSATVELVGDGTSSYTAGALPTDLRERAFDGDR